MFWECHIIQAFWRNVTVFLQNKLSINIELSYKKKSISINFILLLAKYYIFKCKKTEKKHHLCFNLKLVYFREEDWKKL